MTFLKPILICSAVFALQLANDDAWSKNGGGSSKSSASSTTAPKSARAIRAPRPPPPPPPPTSIGSDIRLKRDIVEVATLANGLHLYRFRYKRSEQTYVGVMAQEVINIFPDAVTTDANGYYRVYYGRLGLHMQTWKQWLAANEVALASEYLK